MNMNGRTPAPDQSSGLPGLEGPMASAELGSSFPGWAGGLGFADKPMYTNPVSHQDGGSSIIPLAIKSGRT
jgi:hypothetical protein